MSIVHVASNHFDKHEALLKSIQAIAAEWTLLDAKGHATARKGGELLERYEHIYLHRKYTEMVENGVFGVSKSTCQKWRRVWHCKPQIQKRCSELGLDYETIGLTQALDLIRTPRNEGEDEDSPEEEGDLQDDGDTDEADAGDESQPNPTGADAIPPTVAPVAALPPPPETTSPLMQLPLLSSPLALGAAAVQPKESEAQQETAELTVTIVSEFRSRVPLREIKERLANKEATLRLALSVQAVSADGSEEILGEGEADEIIEYQ